MERTHSGKYCCGKMPMKTFAAAKKLVEEKTLDVMLAVRAAESGGAHAVV
jgi:hypothetical protein